jgi:VIT1/CCC1 family predicted Fe2+/Mn2+ transporter
MPGRGRIDRTDDRRRGYRSSIDPYARKREISRPDFGRAMSGPERSRGRGTDRPHPYPRGRSSSRAVESVSPLPLGAILHPRPSSLISIYSGVVTILFSLVFLTIFLSYPGMWFLLVILFIAGFVSMAVTGAFACISILKGDEEDVGRAYLGLGLSIGSLLLLGVGGVLAWV